MSETRTYRQPWIRNAGYDGLFILFPPILALLVVLFLPEHYRTSDEMPVAAWVVLVLLVDVAHVYSTLFATYFVPARFAANRVLYLAIPAICFVVGVLLYSTSALLFWRLLAYLAVFHFIRQQYGFMRLYSRHEPKKNITSVIDTITVYVATLYPIVYWHCTPGRNFNWFVKGDFIIQESATVRYVAGIIYLVILSAYCIKELHAVLKRDMFNLPRNILVVGTALSWYLGIVHFNGDMTFTLLNVVAHGIPYMALVWLHRGESGGSGGKRSVIPAALVFIAVIVVFAYIEEGLWDGLVWREHASVFGFFSMLPTVSRHEVLAVLIPLLSLPQSTHYLLDGFIWKKGHMKEG